MFSVAVLGACGVDPAPTELQSLVPWFWENYAAGDDEQVAEAVRNLDVALKGVTADEPLEASLNRLVKAQLAVVGLDGVNDPAKAAGMVVATEIGCTLAQVEKVVIALEQDSLYPDVYDTYARKHTTDKVAYLARTAPTLAWDTAIKATIVTNTYTENLKGGARFVKDRGKVESPFGAILVSRTWLPKPAVFEDTDKKFPQDYQIEVYYERSPGRVVHLFGVWREMVIGGLSTEDDSFVGLMTGNFINWDAKTDALCKAAKP